MRANSVLRWVHCCLRNFDRRATLPRDERDLVRFGFVNATGHECGRDPRVRLVLADQVFVAEERDELTSSGERETADFLDCVTHSTGNFAVAVFV